MQYGMPYPCLMSSVLGLALGMHVSFRYDTNVTECLLVPRIKDAYRCSTQIMILPQPNQPTMTKIVSWCHGFNVIGCHGFKVLEGWTEA